MTIGNTSLNIVSKLNMSYISACTIRTITVAVDHSICSQSVCKPAYGAEDNAGARTMDPGSTVMHGLYYYIVPLQPDPLTW